VETQARYVWVGAFTLAVIAAGFAFVYWLYTGGGFRERAVYEIRFDSSVSGLLAGSAVLFNGIRVGEVIELRLPPDKPKQVVATIGIDPATPVRADTTVGMDYQGLTGAPVIMLTGGSPTAPPVDTAKGAKPVLAADPDSGESMTQAARATLKRIDGLLAENSQPLHDVIANFKTFSDALARNSDRVDNVVAGLERMTGGAGKPKIPTYSLTALANLPPPRQEPHGQLSVPEPAALMSLSNDKILVSYDTSDGAPIDNAQWSDNLPVLVQSKLIETLENTHDFRAVSRPVDGLDVDQQLLTEIRAFRIDASPKPTAHVSISAKLMSNGRMTEARVFDVSIPIAALDPASAVAALDRAFSDVLRQLVAWVAENRVPSEKSSVQ
jgi:phospholipid/cholesterol/gamma-HCH transport system substrate-binding protein